MEKSPDFNLELIQHLLGWMEGPRVDFKCEAIKTRDDYEKIKFIKDIVAFANVARRTGKPCYLVFGVDNSTRQLVPFKKSERDSRSIQVIQEGFLSTYNNIISEFIEPLPEITLDYGEVDGGFISYLTILPPRGVYVEPYKIKKYLRWANNETGKHEELRIGDVFIRVGESTRIIGADQIEYLCSCARTFYLDKNDWKAIFEQHKSGDFQRDYEKKPVCDLYFCSHPDQPALQVLESTLREGEKRILITSGAGAGKSFLLRTLSFLLATRNPDICENQYFGGGGGSNRNELVCIKDISVYPIKPIPLYLSLRTTFHSITDLERIVVNQIKEYLDWKDISDCSSKHFFSIPFSNWVLLLDGLDELQNPESGGILIQFLRQLPSNVQFILTSRVYCAQDSTDFLKSCKKFAIAPLKREQIDRFIRLSLTKLLDQFPDIAEKKLEIRRVMRWLREHDRLYCFLENARFLTGFIDSIANLPLPQPQEDVTTVDVDFPKTDQPPKRKSKKKIDAVKQLAIPITDDELPISESLLHDPEPEVTTQKPQGISAKREYVLHLDTLGVIIQRITAYKEAEEIKRTPVIGDSRIRIGDRAKRSIRNIAWWCNWEENGFNPNRCIQENRCDDDSLYWNEHIGYIFKVSDERYRYQSKILHHFLAADYVHFFEPEDADVVKRFTEQKENIECRLAVLHILNQVRRQNGKKPYIKLVRSLKS